MATLVLEQMLKSAPRFEQQGILETIDIYTTETIALYSGPIGPPGLYGPGNVLMTQIPLDQGWGLQERFDFSHLEPHINYELVNPLGSVQKDLNYLLGDQHAVKLFDY